MSTQPLRAFHGDQAIKDKYLARVRAHAAADQLVQGIGWEQGKGCAVGCCLEAYDHSRYPIELGLPEWLALLEDEIFEGLPHDEAMVWPESFLEAIHPGADLEPVRHKLTMRRIDRLITLQRGNLGKHGESIDAVINQTLAALEQVRRCHEAEAAGNVCDVSAQSADSAAQAAQAAWAAESAAWAAARAAAESTAESTAESAAWAAWAAESAAWAAWAAAQAAESAAMAAPPAARAAARAAAWKQEAADLLELLRDAQP